MSNYNKYAKALDEAFKAAREEYRAAAEKLEKAQKAAEAAAHPAGRESVEGEHAWKKTRADAALLMAKAEFKETEAHAWPTYQRTVEELTRRLKAEVQAANRATPDAVDPSGLALLQSGVLNADDLEGLVSRYDGNPTMLRLVSQHCADLAGKAEKTETRAKLHALSRAAKAKTDGVLESWEALTSAAKRMSGESSPRDPSFRVRMSQRWEDFCSKTVEEF